MKSSRTYKFKKGEKLRLDDIYVISGLAGGKWWTADDPNDEHGSQGEDVEIVEDITITITVTRKDNI